MRKEAKRSLLIWPATASATISAMSWFMSVGELPAPVHQARKLSHIPEAVVLDLDVEAVATGVELSARREHGARAMKLPERVAQALGVKAPVFDAKKELAGLVVLEDFDSTPADHDDSELTVTDQRTIDGNAPPAFVGPRRPELRKPEIVRLETPASAPPSLLPKSNRALGKRLLTLHPEPMEVEKNEAADTLPRPIAPAPGVISGEPVAADAPVVKIGVESGPAESRPSVNENPAGWPVTQRLDEQLQALSAIASNQQSSSRHQLVTSSTSGSPIVLWSETVAQKLSDLRTLTRLGDPRAGALIDELALLADDGARRAEQLHDRGQQIQWLCASYAIARRVAVWRPVWEVASTQSSAWGVSDEPKMPAHSIDNAIQSVRADLEETGDTNGWTQYLLLDEIQQTVGQENLAGRVELEQRTVLAQRFLSRLQWHGLEEEQRRWISRDSIKQLADAVRPWAQDAVDYASLLNQIERQETNAIDMAAIDIAGAVQTLRFAENEKAVAIADAVNTYYRNANVRIALSQPMLQRILPTTDPRSVPVRTQMFGSRVRGISRIESDLQVALTPSPDRWIMYLKASGNVRTQSTGLNGPVAVRTSGNSDFSASTPIEVTKRGVRVGDADVDVQGRTTLRGIRTDYDGWPLIGSLVRSIATSRYESLAPRSNRVANKKIRTQIESEIDTQLDQHLGAATEQLSEMVLGPLGKLKLDPQVTDMQTTDQRLLARYRLAGDWQLGAFTARPRAPRTSLMSVQVHQSAVNNTLEQLVPRDDSVTIHEMIRNGAATFGQTEVQIPDDIPADVTVQFARTRPVTVEIDEGRLWVTLRVVRLNRGDRLQLTKFIVRAAYRPQTSGMEASLVREGHLRISGPGMSMRERLPVRAIFNKVLSPNRPLRLTLPRLIDHPATAGLAVSQLELRSGWIGIAISESDAPRIALQTE